MDVGLDVGSEATLRVAAAAAVLLSVGIAGASKKANAVKRWPSRHRGNYVTLYLRNLCGGFLQNSLSHLINCLSSDTQALGLDGNGYAFVLPSDEFISL